MLAYATTIHKSQGSEYPIVIMPFTMQFYVMLQKNLLYTGITRAKRAIVLVGSKKAIGYAVRNSEVATRNTGLRKRLCEGRDAIVSPISRNDLKKISNNYQNSLDNR